ncbi:hypothetical protein ACM66B_000871 [Microbotryomycetes sp. NB124-2]
MMRCTLSRVWTVKTLDRAAADLVLRAERLAKESARGTSAKVIWRLGLCPQQARRTPSQPFSSCDNVRRRTLICECSTTDFAAVSKHFGGHRRRALTAATLAAPLHLHVTKGAPISKGAAAKSLKSFLASEDASAILAAAGGNATRVALSRLYDALQAEAKAPIVNRGTLILDGSKVEDDGHAKKKRRKSEKAEGDKSSSKKRKIKE